MNKKSVRKRRNEGEVKLRMDMNIFIIEDDAAILRSLRERLEQWSFHVFVPERFDDIMSTLVAVQPQLVIIDIQLPMYDGFHWCREIRAISKVPILFLSSRDHPLDMVMAMNMGADDYIQKPFHMDVFLARIQAILRRTYAYGDEAAELLEWNGSILDMKRGLIRKDGQDVMLTKNEFFILVELVKAKDTVISRHDLIRKLWDDEHFVNDNTLTANITRLRHKLMAVDLEEAIVTKKGLGYMATTRQGGDTLLFRYLSDRISWILFYLLSLLFVNLLIWLDNGIAVRLDALLYLNVILLLSAMVFVGWRYRKETRYVISLEKLTKEIGEDWMAALPNARYHNEVVNHRLLMAVGQLHRQKLADNFTSQTGEQAYTAAWVHEVKAPLTAMKLVIEANRSEPVIRTIESEWLRIHLLIDQQLYISRLPTLESDFVLENAGIQKLISMEVREVASWCMEKNIAVEFEGTEMYISTDRKWCRFVIRQLLTNAIQYSPEGSLILMSTSITPEGYVRLTMRDEGKGIASHDLPRIFDHGFTGDNGRLQNAATGLGLYLAQTVGSKIGIRLAARSQLDRGTEMDMIFTGRNAFQDVQAHGLPS